MKTTFRSLLKPALFTVIAAASFVSLSGCNNWKSATPQEKVSYITEKATKKLELNETQRAKFQNLASLIVKAMEEIKAKHKPLGENFQELFRNEETSAADFENLFHTRRESIEAKVPEIATALAEFHASLEPEQRTKVAEFLKRFAQRRGGHG